MSQLAHAPSTSIGHPNGINTTSSTPTVPNIEDLITTTPNSTTPTASDAPQAMQHNPQLITQTRCLRRLYVGGLPTNIPMTERLIKRFFVFFTTALGFTTPDIILDIALNEAQRNFCFIEFRSVWDADAILHLMQGALMGGFPLKINRPRDFHGCPVGLKHYIVGYPPGSFTPPPYTSTTQWIEASTANAALIQGVQEQLKHNQQLLSRTNSNIPGSNHMGTLNLTGAGENNMLMYGANGGKDILLTPEMQYQFVESLQQAQIDALVAEVLPFLEPLENRKQYPDSEHVKHHFDLNSRVVKITQLIPDTNQLIDDSVWLNICDDLREFLLTGLFPEAESSGVIEISEGIITKVVLCRATSPLVVGGEIDVETTAYNHTHTTLGVANPKTQELLEQRPEWGKVLDTIQFLGPHSHPEFVGECYIECRDFFVAFALYDYFSTTVYQKYTLQVSYEAESEIAKLF